MNINRIVGASRITKFDLFVFWFAIIDNLFFPYFWGITVSYSFPFVFLWFLTRVIQKKSKTNDKYVLMEVLAGLSTLFGCFLYSQYASDNIVLYSNLLLAIFSYQLFCRVRDNSSEEIVKWVHKTLLAFVIYVFLFALLFYSDFGKYEQLKHFFAPRLEESSIDVLSGTIRFGYYWSDENNIAYMICAVVVFLLFSKYISFLWKNLLMAMVVVIVVATMSTGGVISLAFTIVVYLYVLFFGQERKISPIIKIIIILLIVALFIYGLIILFNSDVYQLMTLRFEGKTDGGRDSRSSIYAIVIEATEWWQYIFWGYGGRTIVGGIYRSTHNGILHFIIAFGMIVCYQYLKMYFMKSKRQYWKEWIWRVPVFLGFFINIMITEDKIHVLMIMLLAFESKTKLLPKMKYS